MEGYININDKNDIVYLACFIPYGATVSGDERTVKVLIHPIRVLTFVHLG